MTFDPITRIRRFHRAVTTEVGLLDASFLGRGRPLGPARVLNAIGSGKTDVSDIRAYLGLDSGLMSRMLRGLEADGLITIATEAGDGRRRTATLTTAGQKEYAAYEALSDTQAETILSRHASAKRLLEAMDIVASTLGRDRMEMVIVPPTDPRAQACVQAYYAEMGQRFSQGFDVSLSCDPQAADMIHPRGAFVIVLSDGLPVGCGGLKGTDKGYAEIKRVWIAPSARGLGLAHRLMAELERIAVALGITCLRLDTNSQFLPEAVALYRKTGWAEIPRFNDDPYPDMFFEKTVGGVA